jgi:hypothetical protein
MTYEGEDMDYGQTMFTPGSWWWWTNTDVVINMPLPGGKWGCSFSFGGKTLSATFVSGGPTGPVVDTAACRGSHLLAFGRFKSCRTDESAAPITATDSVWCYGVFAGDTGKAARVELVSGQQTLQTTTFTVRGPIWSGWVGLTGSAGQNLAPGSYACRFWLDNALVTEKPFEIAA